MSNAEEFEKIITVMDESPISLSTEATQNVYLGCMARYLAQTADALNEIRDSLKEINRKTTF